ncbi:MAG: alpha/beta hydrolase [Polyangiaceae bacterium]|nr:alpha/beta hydrolase [Polyangiaceae bacterium]
MHVHGALLPYIVQGTGPTILFLHGALADLRMWSRHLALVTPRFSAVSYTQRYFGVEPWGSDWPPFGVDTHAADLVELIHRLQAGPVHLVAWSYAGHIALTVALKHPELIKSAFIYEPGAPTYVSDPAELEALNADAIAMFGPVFEAVQGAGDVHEGVRRLIDGSGQRRGYFDSQPGERQQIQMDNARTMPLLLAQSPPPIITCDDLRSLRMPVCIAYGEFTRPVFSVVSRAAARCISGEWHKVIPGADHMWPDEDPTAFCAAVLDFIREATEGGLPRP